MNEIDLIGLTQSLMFSVVDRVLYLIYIKNEMEWVQSLTQLNGLTQPLIFLVIDIVLYLIMSWRLSGCNHLGLTQSVMFLVVDRVLYLSCISNGIE